MFPLAPQSYCEAMHCLLVNFSPELVTIVELQQNKVNAAMHHTGSAAQKENFHTTHFYLHDFIKLNLLYF